MFKISFYLVTDVKWFHRGAFDGLHVIPVQYQDFLQDVIKLKRFYHHESLNQIQDNNHFIAKNVRAGHIYVNNFPLERAHEIKVATWRDKDLPLELRHKPHYQSTANQSSKLSLDVQ